MTAFRIADTSCIQQVGGNSHSLFMGAQTPEIFLENNLAIAIEILKHVYII